MKLIRISTLLCLTFLILPFKIHAGTTGKIIGKVTDENTNVGLPGVNVVIVGTTLGAASNTKGEFIILNIPPGNYTLKVMMIGYATVLIENAQVYADRTTNQDVQLHEEAIIGEEVVIEAARPLVEKDRTTTAAYISAETIEQLPVQEVEDVIKLQAGIVADANGGLHFRGGRAREVGYLVDGVSVTDAFSESGGSNVEIENSFIKEIQVITGTFDAEYGSAQSGVVNMITKDPGDEFHGEISLYSGNFYSRNNQRFIGLKTFNPFGDKDIQMTLMGPILGLGNKLGFYFSGRYNDSQSHLMGERRFNSDDALTIEAYKHWYRDRFGASLIDTRAILIPDSLLTGDGENVPMKNNRKISLSAKLFYRPIPNLHFKYSIFWDDQISKGYEDEYRYAPDGILNYPKRAQHHIFSIMHAPKSNLFYNLRLSSQITKKSIYAFEDPFDPKYQSITEVDEITGFNIGGTNNLRSFENTHTYLANTDITWQVDRFNEVKAGFEIKKYQFEYKSQPLIWNDEFQSRRFPNGENMDFYQYFETLRNDSLGVPTLRLAESRDGSYINYIRKPLELAAFLQDKLEVGELILKGGIRFDWFDANTTTITNQAATIDKIGSMGNSKDSKQKYQLSPRIGLSFPISSNGAFHVAYGHFFQMPSYSRLFQNPINENISLIRLEGTIIGNPDLKPERTISYEIGLQQAISEEFTADISLYYKDIRDLLGLTIVTTTDAIEYSRYINKDYGMVKGLTVALEKFGRGLISGSIDYTYQISNGSSSDPDNMQLIVVSEALSGGKTQFVERQILPLDWDQRHTVNFTLTLNQQNIWSASIIGNIGSGLPYTPESITERDFPESEFKNSARKPIRLNVDLRTHRKFKLMKYDCTLYMKVFNLFDKHNQELVFPTTGRATHRARTSVQLQEDTKILQTNNLFTLSETDNRPHWFTLPRRIQLGFTVNF
jgi:outer membrane receptor protein involved in Fe transport